MMMSGLLTSAVVGVEGASSLLLGKAAAISHDAQLTGRAEIWNTTVVLLVVDLSNRVQCTHPACISAPNALYFSLVVPLW